MGAVLAECSNVCFEARDNKAIREKARQEAKYNDDVNKMTVYVTQGRNLPDTKSNPYVRVKMGKLKQYDFRTNKATKEKQRNAIWNAQFVEEKPGLFGIVDMIRFELFAGRNKIGCCSIKTDTNPNTDYSTPIQWITLLDTQNKQVLDSNGKKAQVQIQIKYTLNAEDVNIRSYSHIMELTIKKARNIVNKDVVGISDPYVKLEWGSQSYSTRYLDNTLNPVWNETAFIFVDEKCHSKYQLKLCVMDKDITSDDQLGTGYISAAQIFEHCAHDDVFKLDVNLRAIPVSLDRGLLDVKVDDSFGEFGALEVEVRLKVKEKVEKEFYQALVATFDKNADGVIGVQEFREIFSLLKIPTEEDEAFKLFKKFDENNDMKLDENEVVKMLCDADFQGSELAIQLLAVYLAGDLNGDHQRHLMSGLTHKNIAVDSAKAIKIRDRETGLFVQEFIPTYIRFAQKLMVDSKVTRGLVDADYAQKMILRLSEQRGRLMDSPQSVKEIAPYIKIYNLDTNILYKKTSDFKTFNDFFARGIRVNEYRPLANSNDENVIVSPADCRLMCWNSILDSSKVWIKGSKFTLENLCGANSKVNIEKYAGGSFAIARLSIQDYHRWHYPVSGKVINIDKIDGKLFGANPLIINSSIDAYAGNKRAIVEIQCGGKIGNCIMFVISSIMVGSYRLHKKESDNPEQNEPIPLQIGDYVKRGDVAGEFRFGGSTVLLLFEPNKVKFDDDIIRNVNNQFETLVKVRSRIGIIE